MASMAAPLERLIEQLEKWPSIGHKSAQRLAFHILGSSKEDAEAFVHAYTEAREKIHECTVCCNLTDRETCPICEDVTRDKTTICVVADPRDVMAIERTHEYHGLYHVLHGNISPMDGVTQEKLRIKELVKRIAAEPIEEVIMATNPTVEGEVTSTYISKLLAPFDIKVTRLAYGIPAGGDLEYADDVTLRHSLEGRNKI